MINSTMGDEPVVQTVMDGIQIVAGKMPMPHH